MKKNVARILTAVLMLSVIFSSSVFAAEKQQSAWESFVGLFSGNASTAAEDTQIDGVTYQTHIQNDGWKQGWVSDGTTSGSEGRGLRLEGIQIKIDGVNLPDGLGVTYRTQIENDGWLDWEFDGDTSGSVGQGLRLEAIEIKLIGTDAGDYSVGYKTHIQNYGWEKDWSYNGDTSGTVGEGLRLEGIQIEIFRNIPDLTEYEAALEAVTQADYTAASWTTYQAVVAANVVTEDNLVSEVEEATAAITTAQDNLILVPKVTSVTAINARQLQVTFNTALDATDAIVANQVTVVGVTFNAPAAADLSADAKTLTLTTSGAAIDVTNATVTVLPIKTKADTSLLTAKYVGLLTYKDTVAPTITKVVSQTKGTTATSLTVTASEPIQSGLAKIDGAYYTANFGGTNTATITGLSLATGVNHTYEAINLTDYANNKTVSQSVSFTVTTDATAPTATITAKDDHTILVTFDKAMTASTVTTALGNGSVKDEALAPITTSTAVVVANTDNKQFTIDVTATLYTNTTSRTLTVVFPTTIQDSLGNAMTAVNKTVTLTKDAVKPVATGYTIVKDTTDSTKVKSIEINYSEALANDAAVAVPATIVNANGVLDTTTFSTLGNGAVTNNATKVVYTFPTALKINGTFAFSFAKDIVSDLAQTPNKNAAFNMTLDFGTTSATTFDVTSVANAGGNNVFTVTFPEAVKGGGVANSATDIANYTLSGKPLPTGTAIVLNGAQLQATITLPTAAAVTKDDGTAVFTAANIQNTSGTKTCTTFSGTVAVKDNTAPVLQTASFVDGRNIKLTYNEDMSALLSNTTVSTEFSIYQDGGTTPITTVLNATRSTGINSQVMLTLPDGSSAGTAEVNTLTVGGAVTVDGNITVTFNDGGTPVVQTIAVATTDTPTTVAGKIATAFASLTGYTVTNPAGAPTTVVFTANVAAADKTVSITVADTTATSTLDSVSAAAQTTAGVAPVAATTPALDLTKTYTIKPLLGTNMKDASTLGNVQELATTAISISKQKIIYTIFPKP